MSSRNNPGLLARVNFPLYTLQMLTSRHVVVGGGGGSSKTGVANGFVSYISTQLNLSYCITYLIVQYIFKQFLTGVVNLAS